MLHRVLAKWPSTVVARFVAAELPRVPTALVTHCVCELKPHESKLKQNVGLPLRHSEKPSIGMATMGWNKEEMQMSCRFKCRRLEAKPNDEQKMRGLKLYELKLNQNQMGELELKTLMLAAMQGRVLSKQPSRLLVRVLEVEQATNPARVLATMIPRVLAMEIRAPSRRPGSGDAAGTCSRQRGWRAFSLG